MKKNRFVFLSLIIILFLLIPINSNVFAQAINCPAGQVASDLGCIPEDPIGFVQTFYGWGLGLLGFVAVLFIIIGGYYVMTSHGSVEQLDKGKSFIFYAIAGLLLAIFGFVFIEIIAGQVLKIPGFS